MNELPQEWLALNHTTAHLTKLPVLKNKPAPERMDLTSSRLDDSMRACRANRCTAKRRRYHLDTMYVGTDRGGTKHYYCELCAEVYRGNLDLVRA